MITFDFDETLTRPIWLQKFGYFEPSNEPNLELIAKLREFHQQGKEIRIVTTRWTDEGVQEFVVEHQLPIKKIHCNKGVLKASLLKELSCQLHFDDNEAEAIANHDLGISTTLVSWQFDQAKN